MTAISKEKLNAIVLALSTIYMIGGMYFESKINIYVGLTIFALTSIIMLIQTRQRQKDAIYKGKGVQ